MIERDMARTRSSLGDKVGALEEKVVETVKDTAEAVSDTVGAVKETVQSTTQAVADTVGSVKDSLDVGALVRKYPWLMVGGGLALGYVLNTLLVSSRQEPSRPRPARAPSAPPAGEESSVWSDALGSVWDSLSPMADKLKGLALGATTGVLGEVLMNFAPDALKNGLSDLVNHMTQQVGGTILRGQEHHEQHEHQQPGQPQQTRTV